MNRNLDLEYIEEKPGTYCYGIGLGIMVLDEEYAAFPGDIRNMSGFNIPIQYEIVEGLDCELLIRGKDKTPALEPIIRAAKRLERMGCKAITSECGYFAYFQKEIREQVNIPVFMSSLMQVPMAQMIIGEKKSVGVLCAESQYLTQEHFARVGVTDTRNIIVAGARDTYSCDSFETLWNHDRGRSHASYSRNRNELISIVKDFVAKNPSIGALVLECTGMNPFARDIQREVGLPVFSWGTLLDYAYSVVNHKAYFGQM